MTRWLRDDSRTIARLRGPWLPIVVLALLLSRAAAQDASPPSSLVTALKSEGRMTEALLTAFHGSAGDLEALFDHLWETGATETVTGLERVLVPTGENDAVPGLITRFRRAALLDPRLRSLVLKVRPTTPYEASTRVEALRREDDPAKIMEHVLTGVDLGPPWIATLLEKVGRDLTRPVAREALDHVAHHRRQRLPGLAPEPVEAGQVTLRSDVAADDALIVFFHRDGSRPARLVVGGTVIAEIPPAGATAKAESLAVTATKIPRGTLRLECEGTSGLDSVTRVSRRTLDLTCRYRRFTVHEEEGTFHEVERCTVVEGWKSSLVVSGDVAVFPFFLEEDVDLESFRALYLDHWSPSLTGWRTELNGAPFVALTSQPMPRPARVPRLRRGLLRRGRNVLTLRREQGTAPLHLEALWLWP